MSYSGIKPTGEVTDAHRKLFVKLALLAEPYETAMWSAMGSAQTLMKGAGSFHKEGRYLLRSVAKNWMTGDLYCSSMSPKDRKSDKTYYVRTAEYGLIVSTSKEALAKLLPTAVINTFEEGGK